MTPPQAALDDLPDLFSNVETVHIAGMVTAEADRLADLTIDAIRTIDPATGVVGGLGAACWAAVDTQTEPLPLSIGLAFRRSEAQPAVLVGSMERWPRNDAAEARARALMQAGEAAMAPDHLVRFQSRERRLRRFPDGLRTAARREQRKLSIDGIELFRALFEGDYGAAGPDARRLAQAMVLLRFCEAVECALSAEAVDRDVILYVDAAEWPYESGDLDFAPSINRLLQGDGTLVPVD